ncbi:MAG: ThiF family adenylyltransferase [Planctomycetes bacterium]|nr:ThiF family adenylyltransferase [Planctomycetota bacterium]
MSDFFNTQELIQSFEPAFTPALFERSLLVVGLGGNGTHLALAAVRMGFPKVVGVDHDYVSESNLSRQVLYTRPDVGRRRAEAAAEALALHTLRSVIEMHDFDILAQRRRFGDLVAAADLVFVVLDQPGLLSSPSTPATNTKIDHNGRHLPGVGADDTGRLDGTGAAALPQLRLHGTRPL